MRKKEELIQRTLSRMQKYCAREDRSVQKIREKLYEIEDLSQDEKDKIIEQLLEDQFLDDGRFASTFVRSKINQNKWGYEKIKQGLLRHNISDSLLDHSLSQMDQKQYQHNLSHLLMMKQKQTDDFEKLVRFLLQKGYRYGEILDAYKKIS